MTLEHEESMCTGKPTNQSNNHIFLHQICIQDDVAWNNQPLHDRRRRHHLHSCILMWLWRINFFSPTNGRIFIAPSTYLAIRHFIENGGRGGVLYDTLINYRNSQRICYLVKWIWGATLDFNSLALVLCCENGRKTLITSCLERVNFRFLNSFQSID